MSRSLSATLRAGGVATAAMFVTWAFGAVGPIALVAGLLVVLAEVVKNVALGRASRRSGDGNVMPALLMAEGVSLLVDAAAVCAAVALDDVSRVAAGFALCAVFFMVRLTSAVASSEFLQK